MSFNGSSYLSLAANSAFTLGTNNHTIEFWIYQTSRGTYDVPWDYGGSSQYASNSYYMNVGSGGMYLLLGNGASNWAVNINPALPSLNAWHHIAVVRNGNTFTLYIDGVGTSATSTQSISAQAATGFRIAADRANINNVTGYTSNFTVPSNPLTAVANTTLLTCNDATIKDGSSNNLTITQTGSPTVSTSVTPFGPLSTTRLKIYARS